MVLPQSNLADVSVTHGIKHLQCISSICLVVQREYSHNCLYPLLLRYMAYREAPEHTTQNKFDWYRSHGGKLSEPTYRSALCMVQEASFSGSTRSQAIRMMKRIPPTPAGHERRYINTSATVRIYGMLREPLKGECTGWSDEKIFAEVLLVLHYVAGNAAFERRYPNIFHRE